MNSVRALCIGVVYAISMVIAMADTGSGISVVGGLTRQAVMQPGGKVEGKVLLRNTADTPREVRLYLTDYLFYADGRTMYGETGSNPRSNSSWVTFTPRQVTIAPKEVATVYYSLQAPDDSRLKGTYWSVLMVEAVPPGEEALPQTRPDAVTVGVRTVMRYAIQLITTIGNEGTSSVRFADRRLLVAGEHRVLEMDIENTGECWLNPMVWAEIYDQDGASLGRFDGMRMRIFPGCSGRYRIDLSELPDGKFTALVVADNGDDHVFGTQLSLAIE